MRITKLSLLYLYYGFAIPILNYAKHIEAPDLKIN
jgi:hypothetical protein